jgi:L-proline amide hydrolase
VIHVVEGTVKWDGGTTWYRVDGDLHGAGPAPVVILHGGPGMPHDYLESLAVLAEDHGRPCIMYDQLGCGRSEHLPKAPVDFWSIDLFLREIDVLLEHLGIEGRYHILGQSWGGMLGLEHALRRPPGLHSIIVANSPASMPLWIEETARLRHLLPEEVQDTLDKHEIEGTTSSAEYTEATMRFYERHFCRVPYPTSLETSMAKLADDPTVYLTMCGPNEFHVVGSIKDWDITARLRDIEVPVLVISGEHDEATPTLVGAMVEQLRSARWELIADASHCTHLERPEAFVGLVEAFLAEHDTRGPAQR